jgi:hypothetical protein
VQKEERRRQLALSPSLPSSNSTASARLPAIHAVDCFLTQPSPFRHYYKGPAAKWTRPDLISKGKNANKVH